MATTWKHVDYEVVLEKRLGGLGFSMGRCETRQVLYSCLVSATPNFHSHHLLTTAPPPPLTQPPPSPQHLVVTDVADSITIRGISAEAGGEVRVDDALVAVEETDACAWPFSRLKARMAKVLHSYALLYTPIYSYTLISPTLMLTLTLILTTTTASTQSP